ncbi:MAG TPA: hypothetical protein VMM38_16070 [Aridibacter sp.]|nr:hypothetical protein [Aridibacter sp.]
MEENEETGDSTDKILEETDLAHLVDEVIRKRKEDLQRFPPPEAWFLGPKAEHGDIWLTTIEHIFRDYVHWRRNYFPEDPIVVDREQLKTHAVKDFEVVTPDGSKSPILDVPAKTLLNFRPNEAAGAVRALASRLAKKEGDAVYEDIDAYFATNRFNICYTRPPATFSSPEPDQISRYEPATNAAVSAAP